MAGRKKVRSAPQIKRGNKLTEPTWEGWEKMSGEEYHRLKEGIRSWYYSNFKPDDLYPSIFSYMEKSEKYSKDDIKNVKKLPKWRLSTTAAILSRMLLSGMPAYNKKEAEYWESLAGTTGKLKPSNEWLEKNLDEWIPLGKNMIEEEKKQEEVSQEKYVPTIQERIREATSIMCEFIEAAFDDFLEGKRTDFRDVQPAKQLRMLGCKQPHARLISMHYINHLEEYKELLNPPDTSKMDELQKDYVQQLKDAYSHYKKPEVKKLYEFCVSIIGACDAIIAESKANRKPRKMSKKAPEQLVKKIKYKISDEKYSIASIPPEKLIGANCLVVFNGKTRKLGIYYTSVEDPLGGGREGSGLNIKGTTLTRFSEEKSVACTLRKPIDQLQEVKELNTRKKFENWFEKLTTTPVKMNGRINQETVLVAVY